MNCNYCGKQIKKDWLWCPYCGEEITVNMEG